MEYSMIPDVVTGKAYVLGDDIDTDQIIPAQYLVYSLEDEEERKNYGKYALAGVPDEASGLPSGNIPFIREGEFRSEYTFIVAGKNFGCGSSREHAPVALNIAGIKAVIADSYARIFYRNAIDGAFLIPFENRERLWQKIGTGDTLTLYTKSGTLTRGQNGSETEYTLSELGNVKEIIAAGGIFEYARKANLIRSA
jgi:3-isopropylmalate/(R)-2-methylmalate dehydratase small subunit